MDNPVDVNIEIWLMLSSLLDIKNKVNAFNNRTVDLLEVVKANLTGLLHQVENRPLSAIDSSSNEFELMQCVDENGFQFQRFLFCRMCNEHFGITESDIQVHVNSKIHILNLKKLTDSSGFHLPIAMGASTERLVESGSTANMEAMIQNNNEIPENTMNVLRSVTKSNGIHKIIHQRSTLSNIIKTDKVQTYVQHSLSLTISERYNNVKLFPYGSYMYGAASMDSDLNIFLNFDESGVNEQKIEEYRADVELLLRKHPQCYDDVEMVNSEAHGPCIKTHIGSLECTLSFDSAVAVARADLLSEIFQIQPACRDVVLYLKAWQESISQSLNGIEAGFSFSTYFLAVLVIFQFQQRKLVPPIIELEANLKESREKGIDAESNTTAKVSIQKHISDFFSFYGNTYSPTKHIISPYNGKLLAKISSGFPDVCIRDISDTNNNIASNVDLSALTIFQKYCRLSAGVINSIEPTANWNEPTANCNVPTANCNEKTANWNEPTRKLKHMENETANDEWAAQITENNDDLDDFNSATGENGQSGLINTPEFDLVNNVGHDLRLVISNCVQENYIMSSIKKNSKVCHQLMLTDGQKRSIELQFVLKSVMPIVSLEFYGSRIYGAASENSDVNVSIATANLNNNNQEYLSKKEMRKVRDQIAQAMKNHRKEFIIIKSENSARSPLLQVHVKRLNLTYTLSFDSNIPLMGCELIRDFYRIQPICYMLTVYIKDWIEKLNAVHQENDKIYFSNYLITILVIFSLQTQNLLPSVESLQSDSKAGAFRNGILMHYDEPTCIQASKPIKEYLLEFFKLYGEKYNPELHKFSPYYGTFFWGNSQKHKKLRQIFPKLWKDQSMYVQDLFDLRINIAADVKPQEVNSFQRCCRVAIGELDNVKRIRDASRKRRLPESTDLDENETKMTRFKTDETVPNLNENEANQGNNDVGVSLPSKFSETCSRVFETITSKKFISEAMEARLVVACRLKKDDYSLIIDELCRILNPVTVNQPNAFVFGSRIYGVGLNESDLNILLDFDGSYINTSKSTFKDQIARSSRLTMEALKKRPFEWKDIELVASAEYPVVKVTYKLYGIRCNIIFGGHIPLFITQYLASVLDKQPMCRQVILYLQKWQREIKNIHPDSFCFSNYVLTLLVVIFFQTKGLLPRISELEPNKLKPCDEYLVCTELKEFKIAGAALEKYLLDFCELYGITYQPDVHILSAYCGELLEVDRGKRFIRKKKLNSLKSEFLKSDRTKMWMQDIFRFNFNVTEAVTADELIYFQRACRTTAEFLKKSMNSN